MGRSIMGFFKRLFHKELMKSMVSETPYSDYFTEQIERIRRGEPIQWMLNPLVVEGKTLPPLDLMLRSQEIDRLNAQLDRVEEAAMTNQDGDSG